VWAGVADAYGRSFALLCAGAIPALLATATACSDASLALDVGTGTGSVAGALVDRGFRVAACDPEQSMLDYTARAHPNVECRVASLPFLPYPDDSFEVTTANFVVNHVAQPRSGTRELLRVTSPGGQVAVTIWPSHPISALNQLWNDICVQADVQPGHSGQLPADEDFPRTLDGLLKLMSEAGGSTVVTEEVSFSFRIRPDDLWAAVTAGIATIGATYRAQTSQRQQAMHTAFSARTDRMTQDGILTFACTALLARATAR
jgi:SAM-dependent methyltransferase